MMFYLFIFWLLGCAFAPVVHVLPFSLKEFSGWPLFRLILSSWYGIYLYWKAYKTWKPLNYGRTAREMGLHRGVLRYTSLEDLHNQIELAKAIVIDESDEE